jgi:flagellar operon protein
MTPVDLENRILDSLPSGGVGRTAVPTTRPAGSPTFGQALAEASTKAAQDQWNAQAAKANVKFSGHAQVRLASRNITLSGDDLANLGAAITKAAAKGARESLVLMDQAALVVSVPNRTVITAVDKSALKDNIFTNIDSAMIL